MTRIEDISTGLRLGGDGIYYAGGQAAVSYSDTGHAGCFQVEDESFWFRHRNQCISAVVANHPWSGMLLDIGGGNGYVAQRLAADGREVMLLEPGPVGARNARQGRGLAHVACATVEAAGFRPGSFGALGLFDVIEHVEQDRRFLEDIAPLLAPGGMLYLTVPCHAWLWSSADVEAGHFRRHTRASLQALLAGLFETEYFSYTFRPLVLPQWLFRALPHRLGAGRKRTMLSAEVEHGTSHGPVTRAIERLLAAEARAIAAGRSIGFGASAVVAARLR